MKKDIHNFLFEVEQEVKRAQKKFPDNNASSMALGEEYGELAKALLSEPWENVYKEAIQTAAMCARVALEGDTALHQYRAKHAKGELGPRTCPYKGCPAPYTNQPPCPLCYE